MRRISYYVFLLLFFTPSVFWARHIVGGEITYKLKSTSGAVNRYEFTMHIYRDCDPSKNGAPFDPNAAIGIYLKNENRRTHSFSVPFGGFTKVLPPKIDCLIAPDICVEDGIYTWERDLPMVADTYVILYQRCCRNESISNILQPGTVGATYSVEITQAAQELGNNSPVFKSFPPTVICGNYPLKFDHAATDAEGDQLVYRFCEPYSGGGQTGGGGCANTSPTPPCWPPFGSVTYRAPDYSYQRPVGGDPIVTINPNTGLITGTPNVLGQFVVSVCVEEYRNGKLLSILKRDFQFNVAQCDPTIKAVVKADTIIDKTYVLNSCGETLINVVNQSFEQRFVNDFRFDINLNSGGIKTYKEWQPSIQFPDTGVYKGNLFLNPGTICADTINLKFNIFNSVKSDFSYQYDTCIAGPVYFKDNSKTTNGRMVSYKWSFSDGRDTTVQNPSHLYTTPGVKNIRLYVKDVKGCESDTTRKIVWLPVPPLIVIEPSSFTGCSPGKVFFNNLSRPIDSTYNINWTFGDGGTSKLISPSYVYENPGTYSISVDITSPIGCKTSRNFKDFIKIYQGSKADFTFSPDILTKFNNTASFFDNSKFATRWQWFFGKDGYTSKQNPTYSFRDTGIQRVKLIVNNQYGCMDSLTKFLDVIPLVSYHLPNAFSPNDDTVNDIYKGVGIVDGMKNFYMKIWNRWGELIFETANPNEGWNGKKYNKGGDAPQGVYLCVVTYNSPRGENFEVRSYATLIR